MLGTYIDIILYPIQKYFEILLDSTIKNHLGVSILGIAVTCAIVAIITTALVYKINPGGAAAHAVNVSNFRARQQKMIAQERKYNYINKG